MERIVREPMDVVGGEKTKEGERGERKKRVDLLPDSLVALIFCYSFVSYCMFVIFVYNLKEHDLLKWLGIFYIKLIY